MRFDRRRYRTAWISDVHLGFRGCSAGYLLDFLRSTECEILYLVGDIIDIWSMKKRPFWPQAHNDGRGVVSTIESIEPDRVHIATEGSHRTRGAALVSEEPLSVHLLTDTFGLVLLEAMACGVPVAAFPVTGPIDVVEQGRTGILDDDLASAVHRALELDSAACVEAARTQSWERATRVFESLLTMRRSAEGVPELRSG